nr:hypothetical protein [uncultured Methanoregula sp.]
MGYSTVTAQEPHERGRDKELSYRGMYSRIHPKGYGIAIEVVDVQNLVKMGFISQSAEENCPETLQYRDRIERKTLEPLSLLWFYRSLLRSGTAISTDG